MHVRTDRKKRVRRLAMTLTKPMRYALEQAVRQELRRVFECDKPAWPAHPTTLHALVRRGLLARTERRSRHGHRLVAWTPTDIGRAALQPREVFRRQPDLYLTRAVPETTTGGHGEYTTDPRSAICSEKVPIIDPATLDPAWDQIATERRHAAQDRRQAAARLARRLRAA
jgi:hypothetical protein